MQTRGGLVQDVDRAPVGTLLQFRGELDALSLTAGERGGGLTQPHVPEAHLHERGEVARDRGERREELRRLLDGHVQDLRDVLALVVHLEGLAVVARALAHLARDVDVRQEVHLDLQRPVTRACLAAPALDVEREPALLVAADLGLLGLRKQLADPVEHARVRGRVGARGAPDGALVHVHDLVQVLQTVDAPVPTGHLLGAVELIGQARVEDVVDERGLPRTGDARDGHEDPEREVHREVLQVVLPRTHDRELPLLVHGTPRRGDFDQLAAGEVVGRDGPAVLEQLVVGPGVDHVPTVHARARAHVHDPVGLAHGVLVVLDHDEGVAHVPQAQQGVDESAVVALVQPDGRLVQDVEHAHEPRTDLGGEPDALCLPAGQRGRGPLQVEVVQPDVDQERQARDDLLEHLVTDPGLAGVKVQLLEEREGIAHGQAGGLGDVLPAHGDPQDRGVQPRSPALGARHLAHVLLVAVLGVIGLGLLVLALDIAEHALEALRVPALAAPPVAVGHGDLVVLAVQDGLACLGRQVLPRGHEVESGLLPESGEQAVPVVTRGFAQGPRRDGALHEGQVRVGNHEVLVHLEARTDAVALGARAERGVERERARLDLVRLQLVLVGAREVLGKRAAGLVPRGLLALTGHELDDHASVREVQGGLDRVGEPLPGVRLGREAVHDHVDRVLVLLLELGRVLELNGLAVHDGARVSLGAQLLEQVLELALAALDHGGEDHEPGALGQLEQLVHDLLGRLLGDGLTAHRAVRVADPRPQQTHVVVDLGDRAHRGARVARGGLLVDGHRRGQPLDEVHVRLVHAAQEHPGVGGQRLHVAALTLGEDGVEGQGGLPGPGQPREHDHGIAGDGQIHVLEVVLAGTLHHDLGQVRDTGGAGARGTVVGHSFREHGARRTVTGGSAGLLRHGSHSITSHRHDERVQGRISAARNATSRPDRALRRRPSCPLRVGNSLGSGHSTRPGA